jgi:hypothetical protein
MELRVLYLRRRSVSYWRKLECDGRFLRGLGECRCTVKEDIWGGSLKVKNGIEYLRDVCCFGTFNPGMFDTSGRIFRILYDIPERLGS